MSVRKRKASAYNSDATTALKWLFQDRSEGRVTYAGIRHLIQEHADPNVAITGDCNILYDICERMRTIFEKPSKRDQIELLKIFKFLLALPNIDVHKIDKEGLNLLLRTTLLQDSKFLHVLLQESREIYSDINNTLCDGSYTPLNYACEFKHKAPPESIQYLIDAGADCDIPSVNKFTPLIRAIHTAKPEDHSWLMVILNELFRNNSNANIVDKNGKTALHHAIKNEKGYSVYARLLQGGASIDIQDHGGRTPRDLATELGDKDALRAINRFCGIRDPDPSEMNLEATYDLQRLLNSRDFSSIAYKQINHLLMKGANPNVLLGNGKPSLHNLSLYFIRNNDPIFDDARICSKVLRIFQLFLDQPNIDVHPMREGEQSILYRTLSLSRSDFLQTLIMQKGKDILMDINTPLRSTGYPPLHFVCQAPETPLENIRYLLDAGADCNFKTVHGHTPLKCAVLALNDNDTQQKSVLMFMLNELFRNKADPNIQGNDGRTVLHDAVVTGKGYDVCTRLLEGGARFDIRDAKRQTPLDLAILSENYEQQEAIRTGIMKLDRRIAAAMAMKRGGLPTELHSMISKSIPLHIL